MVGTNGDGRKRNGVRRIGANDRRDSQATAELDTAFDLLQASNRRYLLYYLSNLPDETTTLEDAVEAVRSFVVAGDEVEQLPPRQSIRLELVHSHLPQLEGKGVIDYDPRRGEIRLVTRHPLVGFLDQARTLELG